MDEQVDQRLRKNPKVRVEGEAYAYQVWHSVLSCDPATFADFLSCCFRPNTTSRTAFSS